MKKIKLILFTFLLCNVVLFAQESTRELTGIVTSEVSQEPLPGVTVVIKDSDVAVTTNFDGFYTITVIDGDVVEFSYLGFQTKTVTVSGETTLDVSLGESAKLLEEIVVTGYGTQKKSHLTGAISKVVNEKLGEMAVPRVDDALVGQVSGVNIQATDGEAGAAPTIRVRGTGSVTGDSSPLLVIDGIPVSSDFFTSLDMDDIESFEVLKDAASAAIYGSRGANGVIMVTTKQGKEGQTKFSYNTFTGFRTARTSDAYHISGADAVAKELEFVGGDAALLSDKTKVKMLLGVDNTDWQDVIFDGGVVTSHSLSARGGSKKTKYSASLGYLNDEGVLLTDNYERFNARLKLDTKSSDKFSFGVNINPSYSVRKRFDGSTHDILRQAPWLPVYLDERTIQFVNRTRDGGKYANAEVGDYAIQRMFDDYDLVAGAPVPNAGSGTDISTTSNTNPAAKVLERDRRDKKFKVISSIYAKYNFTEDLSFKTTFSADYQNTFRYRWQGIEAHRNGASNTSLNEINQIALHGVTNNFLNYDKSFGSHYVNAILGFSAEVDRAYYSNITGAGYTSDAVKTLNAATILTSINSFEFERRLVSYISRVNYAYEDKYLASISMRVDGSSVFGPDNKYGTFFAASAGWNIAKEVFLEDNDIINDLKLRVSYGVTGNDKLNTGNYNIDTNTGSASLSSGDIMVDNYPYLSLLGTGTAVVNGVVSPAFNSVNIANSELQWERSVEINPGIDFGLLKNRISGSVDYYRRTSDKLLLNNPVSVTTGFDKALVNLGEVTNEGFEMELRSVNVNLTNFSWSTTLLGSMNKNTLTDFGDSDGQIQNVDSKRAAEWINSVGNPISSYYGWVVDEEIALEHLSAPFAVFGGQAQDVYVKDLNGDGVIDDDDKTILGNPYPDLVWSITNEFKIGDFDFSFLFQGSHGAETRNMADQYIFNQFNSGQDFDPVTTPNQGFIKQKIFTNSIIQDASYIALRNMDLGYTLPKELLAKVGISKLRIYASARNLMYLTADDYTGFNPEAVDKTSPTTYGYQRGGSPVYSTLSLGLNLNF